MARKNKFEVKSLYYITHINNLRSILDRGILSHMLVEKDRVNSEPVYDTQIVLKRKDKQTPNGKSLWEFANLYFQPRNPMLFRVVRERGADQTAIVGISPSVIRSQGIYIADGNAAHSATIIYPAKEGVTVITENSDILMSEWWKSNDGSKRKIMAECLVPNQIKPKYVHSIYVANLRVAKQLREQISSAQVEILPEPKMFFLPDRRLRITESLSLVEGDMFFSTMQTLTVSVNTVGIMGKGLASRTKYQFPDVYVVYQDACKEKLLKMGQPYLYKREASFDEELVDEPGILTTPNSVKWFLLFATKRHWRENSDIHGIEQGLAWLVDHHHHEAISSLALPALGCGLGQLDWKDIGPLMCKYLTMLNKPVSIYLPREKEIPSKYLLREYLLGK